MASQMIMSSHAGLTFMYRVGGILIHDDRLLVEWNAAGDYCFVPGGRVEYGETASAALRREAQLGCWPPPTISSCWTAAATRRSASTS